MIPMTNGEDRRRRIELSLARIELAVRAASVTVQNAQADGSGTEDLKEMQYGIGAVYEKIARIRTSLASGQYEDAEAQLAEITSANRTHDSGDEVPGRVGAPAEPD